MHQRCFWTILTVTFLLAGAASPATIHIPADAASIQAGIDLAGVDDTVLVAPGTYTGSGNVGLTFNGKSICVIGEAGPDATIIDGEGESVTVFSLIEEDAPGIDSTALIRGFTITNAGNGFFLMYASPRLEHLILYSLSGWGVASISPASPIIRGCTFVDNANSVNISAGPYPTAVDSCGFVNVGNALVLFGVKKGEPEPQVAEKRGALNYLAFVRDSYFEQNVKCFTNDGMTSNNAFVFDRCQFVDNTELGEGNNVVMNSTVSGGTWGLGGGACHFQNCLISGMTGHIVAGVAITAQFIDCEIAGNAGYIALAYRMSCYGTVVEFTRCAIHNNQAAISVHGDCRFAMTDCSYWQNAVPIEVDIDEGACKDRIGDGRGGACAVSGCSMIANESDAFVLQGFDSRQFQFANSLLAMNSGAGIRCTGDTSLYSVTVSCCDFFGNDSGNYVGLTDPTGTNNNISEDPLFCDTAAADYYISSASPCTAENSGCGQLIGAFGIGCGGQAPSAPLAVYPPDTSGLPVFDMLPTFRWTAAVDPNPLDTVCYRLEIAPDSAFAGAVVIDSLTLAEYELTDSLAFGTQYWWRVTAWDRTGQVTSCPSTPDFWTWTLGDLNHSHETDIADLALLVWYMFSEGPAPYPMMTGDMTGDCAIDITDLVHLVSYMFKQGPPPLVGCD